MFATAGLCIFSNLEALPNEVQHKVNPKDGLAYVGSPLAHFKWVACLMIPNARTMKSRHIL
jgi:hypothetical protein